eukprot:4468319-Amphidinium_carterae.1
MLDELKKEGSHKCYTFGHVSRRQLRLVTGDAVSCLSSSASILDYFATLYRSALYFKESCLCSMESDQVVCSDIVCIRHAARSATCMRWIRAAACCIACPCYDEAQ